MRALGEPHSAGVHGTLERTEGGLHMAVLKRQHERRVLMHLRMGPVWQSDRHGSKGGELQHTFVRGLL